MPQGLQTFDASGNLLLTVSQRTSRVAGWIDTGGNDGSFDPGDWITGTPFVFCSPTNSTPNSMNLPNVRLNGRIIQWTYFYRSSFPSAWNKIPARIYYGCY